MFKKILVPVDLAHVEQLESALKCAADLAKLYEIPVVYVAATSSAPSATAHNPEEFKTKLAAFAQAQEESHGITASSLAEIVPDPSAELDSALMKAIDETGADLVVMQSHIPTLVNYVWPTNGGKIAAHASASVLVVRS